jgi:hypothetical protein
MMTTCTAQQIHVNAGLPIRHRVLYVAVSFHTTGSAVSGLLDNVVTALCHYLGGQCHQAARIPQVPYAPMGPLSGHSPLVTEMSPRSTGLHSFSEHINHCPN